MQNIKENLRIINENIEKSKKSEQEVTLVAVTKTIDIEKMAYLLDLGVHNFGENKVQELLGKYEVLPKTVKWHFIGHLQTNKVKYIIDKVCLIHSVDSVKLAEEINKCAKKAGIIMDILVQVNISSEESKFGIAKEEIDEFLEIISKLSNISVKGLMTMAPFSENPEENRLYFINMQKLLVDIRHKSVNNIYMQFLSMGMTNDYQIAIEEGANMVRIGSAIFGARL
ncbi:MAG: YggS family pyridoxal phosphate-dependent enzyme [Defluviitaleaceae bacterium]|nr:YggS family pyridoxal phosphate-dependent enzyme [Defluviitaleaceae bacterium]